MIESKTAIDKKRGDKHTSESEKLQTKSKQFWQESNFVPSADKYNLTVCEAPKFIWFRNAKVGTRSIFSALDKAGVELTADSLYSCYYFPKEYKNYFKFAFVRNPWDRLVSGWKNKVVRKNTFKFDSQTLTQMQEFGNFVAYCAEQDLEIWDTHFRYQSKLIDLNEVNYIGRLENFDADLREVFRILGISISEVPVMNKTNNRLHYSSYYTDETRDMISHLYRKDIQLFGYEFDDRRT